MQSLEEGLAIRARARDACKISCPEVGRTVQSQAVDADINVIVSRFLKTKQLPLQLRPVINAEFSEQFDFQQAQNRIIEARDLFNSLPSKVRTEFANDPVRFVEFCSDDKNLPRMRELGLAVPEVAKPAVSEVASSGSASAASA